LATNTKVQKMSKRFQQERRAKRKEKLLRLFVELHEEFEELVPAIRADISNLLCLADIFHHVDRAVGIIKRYRQLANEAQHLGLEPPPVSERTRDAMQFMKQGLKLVGAVPFGFDNGDGQLTPNPGEMKTAQSIVSLRQQGESYQSISDHLNAQGIA